MYRHFTRERTLLAGIPAKNRIGNGLFLFLLSTLLGPLCLAQSLPELVQEIRRKNPAFLAAFHEWQATKVDYLSAGDLDDPAVEFGMSTKNLPEKGTRLERLILSQNIPLGGKRKLRRQAAGEFAQQARHDLDAVAASLTEQFLRTYADFYYTHRAILANRDHIADLVRLADQLASANQHANPLESALLDLEIEISNHKDQLTSQERGLRPMVTQLNQLLGRPKDQDLPPARELPPLVRPNELSPTEYQSQLAQANSSLVAQKAQYQAETFSYQHTLKSRTPDIQLGFEFANPLRSHLLDDGDSNALFLVGFNIPLSRHKYRNQAEAARLRVEALALQVDSAQEDLHLAYELAWYEFDDADRKLAFYRDKVVPKAQTQLEKLLATNQEAPNAELVALKHELRLFKLTVDEAEANRFKAWVSLKTLLGSPPFAPPPSEAVDMDRKPNP